MDWNDFTLITVPALITLFGVLITISVQSKNHIKQINADFEVEKKRSFYNNKLQVYESIASISSNFLSLSQKVVYTSQNIFFNGISQLANDLEVSIRTKSIYISSNLETTTYDLVKYANRIALVYGQENDFEVKIKMISDLSEKFSDTYRNLINYIQDEYQP